MEGNKVAQQEALEGRKKTTSFPVQGGEDETMAAAYPAATTLAVLARPLWLLRHVAHGFAGYLGGLASRLKPAAAAADCHPQQQVEEGKTQAAAVVIEEEEVVVVQVRSRGMTPQRPRELIEGRGGVHH